MPKIFGESGKIKVIEYGNSESLMDIVLDAKDNILKTCATVTVTFFKFIL